MTVESTEGAAYIHYIRATSIAETFYAAAEWMETPGMVFVDAVTLEDAGTDHVQLAIFYRQVE